MDQKKNDQTVFRCKYCGNIINPENMFCSSCGAPIPSMSRPNQDSLTHASTQKPSEDIDDLPVINTDEIFKDLDYSSHINMDFDKKEDDLPVIDVDGIFDDVPFADTSRYQNTPNQYYNMKAEKQAAAEQPQARSQVNSQPQPKNDVPEQQPVNRKESPVQRQNASVPRQPVRQPDIARSVEQPLKQEANGGVPPMQKSGRKKKNKIYLFIVLAVAAALFIWCFGFRKSSKNADLLDLCTVKYTGVNGNGNIELTFNERCDLYDNFAVTDNVAACEELKKVTFIATPSTGLSNGDTVTIRADYSNADLSKYKIKVKNTTKQVEVSGLEDSAAYDLFSGITVTFEGYEGSGKAVLDTSRCDAFAKENVTYSVEGNRENLKNGEFITVKAEVEDSVLEEKHYSVETKEKDYIVQGLLGAQDYDVFENISINYSGASPRLSLSVDTSACSDFVKNDVEFSLSTTENVAIGDKITITAKVDDDEAQKQGYKVVTKTKTLTVNNVSSYLSSIKSSESEQLTSVLTSYLTENKSKNGNSYFFDQDLDDLFNDGNSYTYKSSKDEVAARYFLYDKSESKTTLNSYILIVKYTVSAQCEETGEVKEAVLYAETSVTNIFVGGDRTTLKYDSPSEIITDPELNYFEGEVNKSGYSIGKLK